MAKIKPIAPDAKDALKTPKNGSIAKSKPQKFKNTPTGKVSLIDSSKNGKQVSKKNGVNKGNSKFSKNTGKNVKKEIKVEVKEEEEDDSDSDINEGISVEEEVSIQGEDDDDDSSDEEPVPNILGASLAEETDDSDEEFEGSEEESEQKQGVKMFKGVKREQSDESEEEEDDDDEDDDSEDHEESALGLSALLGESIKDESGDEDFESCEEDEDDEEEDDDEESDSETPDQTLNSSNVTSSGADSDEDEDDDDDSPGLTDLLGNLDDESDDEDFEGDEDDEDEDDEDSSSDDEENDEMTTPPKKSKKAKSNSKNSSTDGESPKSSQEEKEEADRRTIFVGNVPKDTQIKRLKTEFKRFGPIQSVRIRGIVPEDPNMPLKVAAIKQQHHPKVNTVCCFVVFENEDSVEKALSMNGKKLDGNYLRVDRTIKKKQPVDKKKAVFLGNLPFTIEDNDLWDAFKDCGRIDSVRICRNRKTGIGLGYGFINFETADGAVLALKLDGTQIQDRPIRVNTFTPDAQKVHKVGNKMGKKRQRSDGDERGSPKKFKSQSGSPSPQKNSPDGKRRSQGEKQRKKFSPKSPESKAQGNFQGQTADTKNKSKQNKSSKKKKAIAAKLLAKPKKPAAN